VHADLAARVLAAALISVIRILLLGLDTLALDIIKSLDGPATIATVVFGITIDELLLREGVELVVLKEVSTFTDTNSRESPARTALTLILDTSDGTLGTPIKAGRSLNFRENSDFRMIITDRKKRTASLLIRELGPTISSKRIDLVELGSLEHVSVEDSIAFSFLLLLIDLVELLFVSNPERIGLESKCKSTGDECKQNNSLHFQ